MIRNRSAGRTSQKRRKKSAARDGLVISSHGRRLKLRGPDGKIQRCAVRSNLPPLVCGDRVRWLPPETGRLGVVESLLPRATLLARPSPTGTLRPVAANLDLILVVIAPRPEPTLKEIDAYLANAEYLGIAPGLVVNKAELLDEAGRAALEARYAHYADIGYALIFCSAHSGDNLDALQQQLAGRCSILVGQSGVGKSSLTMRLLPEVKTAVGALSDYHGLGRHTTSSGSLYPLPKAEGGFLIDSPGVRDFGLWHVPRRELARQFIEFRPHIINCRFRDCSHLTEPDCAVRAAVEDGSISGERMASYAALWKEAEN